MSDNVFRSGVIFKVPPHFVQVAIGRHFVFVSSQATLMLSLVPRPSPGPALGKLNSRFCKSPESRYKYLEIPWVTNFSSVKVKQKRKRTKSSSVYYIRVIRVTFTQICTS